MAFQIKVDRPLAAAGGNEVDVVIDDVDDAVDPAGNT